MEVREAQAFRREPVDMSGLDAGHAGAARADASATAASSRGLRIGPSGV